MKYAVGEEVIWFDDLSDPLTLHRGRIEVIQAEWAKIDGEFRHRGFLFPARVQDDLLEIVKLRRDLKKTYDDSMKHIYELTNAIARGEK